MKLMVFVPTWLVDGQRPGTGTAVHPLCSEWLEAQASDADCTACVGTDNPYPVGDHRNVLHQYRKAQAQFLAGPYDALLTVEHDMVLPDMNAVQRLLDTDGDVVYGVYLLRHGLRLLSAWRYDNDRNVGMSLSNYPAELHEARSTGAWRVSGVGFGCTLFRRHVLEKIAFRDGGDGVQWAPDIPFAEDALREKFVSVAQFSVLVVHAENDNLLWPFGVDGMETERYTARETINVMVPGGARGASVLKMVKGEAYDLTPDQAHGLVLMGLVDMFDAPVAAALAAEAGEPIEDETLGAGSARAPETTEAPANRRRRGEKKP